MIKPTLRKALPLLALVAGAAQADTGSWTPLGDVLLQGGTVTLTTAYTADEDAPFNLSGSPAAYIDQLEATAGVAAYTLDLPTESAYEGSLVTQSFNVVAGQTLQLDWLFTTRETLFEDRAFLVAEGNTITLATRSTAPAATSTLSYTFTHSGLATVSIGVVDTGDFNGVSTLKFSNVQLAPVPEPASWLLMLAGAAALGRRLQSRTR